jgi:putative transcription factor
MSYCELCGRQTSEKKKIIVDGTIFNVCIGCSKHGKPYTQGQAISKKKKATSTSPSAAVVAARPKKKTIGFSDETMLTPNFAGLIREARMKMGLTHEQLGMRMNEKAQMLRKFETGTLKPDELLSKKLERFLGIKLYVNVEDKNDEQ